MSNYRGLSYYMSNIIATHYQLAVCSVTCGMGKVAEVISIRGPQKTAIVH